MQTERALLYNAMLLFVLTLTWIVLMALSMGEHSPLFQSMDDALTYVKNPDTIFYLNYANAVLLTVVNTMLFALLYLYFHKEFPVLSIVGLIFIPVYAAYNLFAYASQISIIQQIQTVYMGSEYEAQRLILLSQLIQSWGKSSVAFINNFAYALLGIPSIAFGVAFLHKGKVARVTGWLLIISGMASIIGIIGIIAGDSILSLGSSIAGVLFLIFLVFVSVVFWRELDARAE